MKKYIKADYSTSVSERHERDIYNLEVGLNQMYEAMLTDVLNEDENGEYTTDHTDDIRTGEEIIEESLNDIAYNMRKELKFKVTAK